jgi:hypothetical protein
MSTRLPSTEFVNDAGLPWNAAHASRDPFAALDDLMYVVEGLCPRWPERPTFEASKVFLL